MVDWDRTDRLWGGGRKSTQEAAQSEMRWVPRGSLQVGTGFEQEEAEKLRWGSLTHLQLTARRTPSQVSRCEPATVDRGEKVRQGSKFRS